MIRAYLIPVEGRTFPEFCDAVSSMPIQFDGERSLKITADGYVELDGSIPGQQEIDVRTE